MASVLATIDDGEVEEGQRTAHRFLTGIHRPMEQELTLTELEVRGTIPPALCDRYLRTGPNPIAPDPASYHWFTGDGMVHGLAIRDGKVLWYRNRWIGSHANAAARGMPPAPGPRHGPSDTVNTNVVDLAGRVFAVVEGGSYPVALSETLDEQHYDDFGGSLAGSFTAHPHRDPLTGEHHGICYEGRCPNEIRHVVLDATGKVVRREPIAVEHGPMIHDCAITARYVVILDLPDGRVVLDVCVYPTMFAGEPGGPDATSRGLERWTLDPVSGTTIVDTIDAAPQEFPRIDERRFGQPYRYAYAMATQSDHRFQSAGRLYKHDLVEGGREVHAFGADRHPGEFVFVPAHRDAGEDEGWLIGFVIDERTDTTELVILNAARFEGAPVATVRLPHRVPPGFHGNWINEGNTQ
jgi:carotenoid cleavage dioxygenase-like enzyme